MLNQNVVNVAYLIAAILFILDLKWMAHPRTAVRGNAVGALGMGLAILATLLPERMRKAIPEPSKAGADEQSFRRLLKPTTKSDAPEDQPGYKERERDAMQRLIEATTPDTAQVEGSAE